MVLRNVQDADLAGKVVLFRSPYDIAVVDGELTDTSRIEATLPTLQYLLSQDCKIVILTYVGRPNGQVVEELRTTPHAKKLSELLNHPVTHIDDCIGEKVKNAIEKMQPRDILMLENTRFYPEEKKDEDEFAQALAKNGEVIVYDGFPQVHRIHASTTGILRHLPSYAGFYMQGEVQALQEMLEDAEHPFTVIIGGAKVSDKVEAVKNLMSIADIFLVGGGVANVFMKAQDKELGASFIEDVYVDVKKGEKRDWVELAEQILTSKTNEDRQLERMYQVSSTIELRPVQPPYDLIIADSIDNPTEIREAIAYNTKDVVPSGWAALDIGPQARAIFTRIIMNSKTVFWNGPMGMFEDKRFAVGSKAIAKAMESTRAKTIIGGGDTIAVANKYIDLNNINHVSLAGGATLEFLAGKTLPVLEMLKA